ncbi:MAG: hypothetical protein ACREDR_00255 [Blastocatellia bacterium]
MTEQERRSVEDRRAARGAHEHLGTRHQRQRDECEGVRNPDDAFGD